MLNNALRRSFCKSHILLNNLFYYNKNVLRNIFTIPKTAKDFPRGGGLPLVFQVWKSHNLSLIWYMLSGLRGSPQLNCGIPRTRLQKCSGKLFS
jgi:hypothetical protein